jgi:hypothetical protein
MEQVAAQYAIPRSQLRLMASESDFVIDEIVLRLVRSVVTVPGIEQVRVPATWWDALKEAETRRSPIMRWWVARRPIKYRVWRALEVLPNFPELDKYRPTIRIARLVPE